MPESKTKAAAAAPPSPSVARTMQNGDSKILESSKYPNVSINKVTGRWQAWTGSWTKCMAISWDGRGSYVGEFTTEDLAARGQDRSRLKHRALGTKLPIKLNFDEADYASDEKLRNALTNQEFIDLLKRESRPCYKRVEPTRCMQTFMAAEAKLGNLRIKSEGKAKYKVMPLRDYLTDILMKRPDDVADTPAEMLKKEKAVKKAVDDLLRDDPLKPEKMDIAYPFPALKREKMDYHTETEKMDVEDPIQGPEEEGLDISNLLMLAELALTHEDLRPYEV